MSSAAPPKDRGARLVQERVSSVHDDAVTQDHAVPAEAAGELGAVIGIQANPLRKNALATGSSVNEDRPQITLALVHRGGAL